MFGDIKQLSLKTINASSPYDVMMVNPNTYRFVTDYSVEIAISFDLDDLLEHGEAYMFNITNVNKQRSPRDMKVRDTVIAIIDNFFETNETVSSSTMLRRVFILRSRLPVCISPLAEWVCSLSADWLVVSS